MIYGMEVGAIIRMPSQADWGRGQVQSIVGDKITVNFEHHGKVVLLRDHVTLELIEPDTL